ncbi:transposable element tcb2 transposase [Trichonephila clavipes]|nr:transposable element tcb2 transposase [Trichonephila clavipes]
MDVYGYEDNLMNTWSGPWSTCQERTVQAGGGSLVEHSFEFRLFRWPPKSPDMNIIEYIWDALQHAVQKRSPLPLTPTDLWTTLLDSWCHLPPALFQTLIEAMPDATDEAHFWLNDYVKKQNCRIWSEANPQVYVETPLHPEKLTVWCALWAGGIRLQKR